MTSAEGVPVLVQILRESYIGVIKKQLEQKISAGPLNYALQ